MPQQTGQAPKNNLTQQCGWSLLVLKQKAVREGSCFVRIHENKGTAVQHKKN